MWLKNKDIMKTEKIIYFLLLALFLLSCNKQQNNSLAPYQNEDGTDKFIPIKKNFSDFIVLNSSLDNGKSPYAVTYAFKGAIKNNTKNIYKKAFIKCELILVLENGNELNSNKISYTSSLMNNDTDIKVNRNWKPNEEWFIDELQSCKVSKEYFDYPVKQVYTQYYVEVEDQVNNQISDILVSQNDVTEKWNKAKEKIKNDVSDCSDDVWELSSFLSSK